MPNATAILDRFLHEAEIIAINGRSCLRNNKPLAETAADQPKLAIAPTGTVAKKKSKTADATTAEACQS